MRGEVPVRQESSQSSEPKSIYSCRKTWIVDQIACVGQLDKDIQSMPVDMAAWP